MEPIAQSFQSSMELPQMTEDELQKAMGSWISGQIAGEEADLSEKQIVPIELEVDQVKMGKYLALLQTISASIQAHSSPVFNELNSEIETLLAAPDSLDKTRSLYLKRVVPLLRDSVDKDLAAVSPVCYDLFTKNDLSAATKRLFAMFDGMGTYANTLLEDLKNCKSAIDGASDDLKILPSHRIAASVRDHFDCNFDPAEMGNPHQIFRGWDFFQGTLKVIAMGSPTIQGLYWPFTVNTAKVDPLFKGYLTELQKRGEKHLYCSFQDARGSESARNDPLMKFGDHSEQLIAMTCSKNSPFYEGHDHAEDREDFKKQVHEQFYGLDCSQSGCYIPPKLDLEEKSPRLIHLLADLLFSEKSTLNERKALIDFYYALMISSSAYEGKVSYMNFTCKDAIDRGMEALAEFCLLWFSVKGEEMDAPHMQKIFREILFSRAYWVRKRSMLDVRFDRFNTNAEVWLEKWKDHEKRGRFIQGLKELIPIEVDDVATIY